MLLVLTVMMKTKTGPLINVKRSEQRKGKLDAKLSTRWVLRVKGLFARQVLMSGYLRDSLGTSFTSELCLDVKLSL